MKCPRNPASRQGRVAAPGSRERARADECRGVRSRWYPEGRTRASPLNECGCACARHARGGASRARPEFRRMMSASDRRRPGLAAWPGQGAAPKGICGALRHGRMPPLEMRGRRRSCERQPRIRKPVRHRPVSALNPAAGRRDPAQGLRTSPVAGLALCPIGAEGLPADHADLRLSAFPAARYGTVRGAFLPPGRARSRSIRRREYKQSGTGMAGGEKGRWIFLERRCFSKVLGCGGAAAVPRRKPRTCGRASAVSGSAKLSIDLILLSISALPLCLIAGCARSSGQARG